jgi:hypothetical protein
MKIITKLLIASAVAVTFAAPAFAIDYNSDAFILQERGAAAQQMQGQTNEWTGAYAMDNSTGNGPVSGAWADRSPYANRGADQVTGGM